MRVAVIGHVEWVEFARVERVPAAGDIVRAEETWEEPAGGGAVAAVQMSKLAGGGGWLFTALGDDDLGRRAKEGLERLGLRVEAVFRRGQPQRRCFVFIDRSGERTITTIGPRLDPLREDPLPWEELADADAVFLTAGDRGALEAGRAARVLAATSRVLARLQGLALDALIGSGRDPDERYRSGALDPAPRLWVATAGSEGGSWLGADGARGKWEAAPLPGPMVDAYGAGDSFAGGLTFALGAGMGPDKAVALAARCGAASMTGRGPYGGQLTASR